MASNRQRGRNLELKAKKWLEKQGYHVQIAPTPTRWARQTDLWGLWDLVGVNETEVVCVQVKMNRKHVYRKNFLKHREWKCPSFVKKLCYLWPPRQREPTVIDLNEERV